MVNMESSLAETMVSWAFDIIVATAELCPPPLFPHPGGSDEAKFSLCEMEISLERLLKMARCDNLR